MTKPTTTGLLIGAEGNNTAHIPAYLPEFVRLLCSAPHPICRAKAGCVIPTQAGCTFTASGALCLLIIPFGSAVISSPPPPTQPPSFSHPPPRDGASGQPSDSPLRSPVARLEDKGASAEKGPRAGSQALAPWPGSCHFPGVCLGAPPTPHPTFSLVRGQICPNSTFLRC